MSKKKLYAAMLVTAFSTSAICENAIQRYWDFSDTSRSNLEKICSVWYENLEQKNYKELEKFYPSKLVDKYKQALKDEFDIRRNHYMKTISKESYTRGEPTLKRGKQIITIKYRWKAPKVKSGGIYGCSFTKQKNGNWAFGNILH